jgi:hypothetical protein
VHLWHVLRITAFDSLAGNARHVLPGARKACMVKHNRVLMVNTRLSAVLIICAAFIDRNTDQENLFLKFMLNGAHKHNNRQKGIETRGKRNTTRWGETQLSLRKEKAVEDCTYTYCHREKTVKEMHTV